MPKPKGSQKTGGRTKGTANKATQELKNIIDSCVDMNQVVGKLYELVNGVTVQETKGEAPVVYQKPPDSFAAKILLEYRYGKPQQYIDVTSKGEKFTVKITE